MIHSKSITRIHCNKKWLAVWFALIAFTVNAQSAKAQFSLDTSKPQVRVEAIPQYDPAPTGQPFALAIVFDIAPGGHLYANPKKGELGLDTKITPVSLEGIRFGNVVYDPGILYTDKNNEGMTNQVYEGKVVCYLPVEIDKAYAKSPLTVDLNLSGLLCTEDGSCIPWDDKVSVSINVTADPAAAKMNQEELFAGKNIALVFSGPGVDSGNGSNDPIEQKSTIVLPDYDVQEVSGKSATTSAWVNLLMALIAGMLLNLMPCVLPVIPLKVLSLLQQGQAARESGDKYKAVKLSLVFSAGILIVFVALAIIMSGFQMLYGQQFQSSGFKFVMLMIIFTLGLSMLGLFEVVLPGRMTNINIVKQGYIGALGMGVLATLLATPCSAPLLGPVLAWSLNQPTVITVAVFIVVGIGMSLPYLLLTAFPKMLDRLPKPGMWMIRLKEGLGFVMLAVAGYLVFLFPPEWHWPLVGFCIVLAFALWLAMKVVNAASPVGKRGIVRIVAMVLVAGAGWYVLDATKPKEHTEFSLARFVALQNEGKNIMVEFTADWCPNCKYVEKTVLKSKEFQDRLLKNDIIFMVADWTQKEPQITQLLNKLGSKSIPFAAVFDGDEPTKPVALRDIYTLETALKALDSVKE